MKLHQARLNEDSFKVIYETFITNYKKTILATLKYLNINIPNNLHIGKPHLKKQSDELNDKWLEEFLAKKSKQSNWIIDKIFGFNNRWLQKLLKKFPKKFKLSANKNRLTFLRFDSVSDKKRSSITLLNLYYYIS